MLHIVYSILCIMCVNNNSFSASVSRQYCANLHIRGRIGAVQAADVLYQGPFSAAAPGSEACGAASFPGKGGIMRPAAEPVHEFEAPRERLSRPRAAGLLINENLNSACTRRPAPL